MDALREGVGEVDEAQHERELQRGIRVQVDILQRQGTDEADQRSNALIETGSNFRKVF